MNKYLIIAIIALALILIASYFLFFARLADENSGSPETSSPQQVTDVPVAISGNTFLPDTITINRGTKVIWTNNDISTHTVNSSLFNSRVLSQGEAFEYIFNEIGSFDYTGNLQGMEGTVVVK